LSSDTLEHEKLGVSVLVFEPLITQRGECMAHFARGLLTAAVRDLTQKRDEGGRKCGGRSELRSHGSYPAFNCALAQVAVATDKPPLLRNRFMRLLRR
jgi:hypothetical protein